MRYGGGGLNAYGAESKSVRIVYFSGTGGTKRIAEAFYKEARQRSLAVAMDDIAAMNLEERREFAVIEEELLILLFVVHAFDAPEPVFDWIHRLPRGKKKAAVISVSGGGEIWPNTGCRKQCCRALEKKGYEVVYENMMCMPCNWMIPANDHVAMRMLQAVPAKVSAILDDLSAGKILRSHQRVTPLRSLLIRWERKGIRTFPRSVRVTDECNGCGWCARHCPVGNIVLEEGKARYLDHCIMCFRCIYGCPHGGLASDSVMVLKEGYDLRALEKRMEGVPLDPVSVCSKGILWIAVKRYLQEIEDMSGEKGAEARGDDAR